MRLTLVISSLAPGGAERVMSIMANYWAERGVGVTLITLSGGRSSFYELDPAVRYEPLGITSASRHALHGLLNNISRIRTLRRAISNSEPDVVISFITTTNVLAFFATRWLGAPVILSEHIEPTMFDPGAIWRTLRRLTYPFADRVILLSERARNYYPRSVRTIARVIPNPVVPPPRDNADGADAPLKKPAVVAMGRFDHQKGFDILMNAFAKIKDEFPGWTLTILGDGRLRAPLEAQRDKLGLAERVVMPGRADNPYDYLKRADLFVLSSRFEGFPMALCEAMACGAAVISFDCPTGPREIVRDGVDGVLVPPEDTDALAGVMTRLMGDQDERRRLAAEAPRIVERFGVETVMAMWEEVIDAAVGARPGRRGAADGARA